MLLALFAGFVFGFVGSVPVAGPIAVLVLERSLAKRYTDAEGIALGGALAESFYAGAAFLGLGYVVQHYPVVLVAAHIIGAIVLFVVAGVLYRGTDKPPEVDKASVDATGRARGFTLGFSLTAFNPTLLATWSAVAAGAYASLPLVLTTGSAIAFPIGACAGIATWLFTFVRIIKRGGEHLSTAGLRRIRYAMVVFVAAIGCWFAYQAVRDLVG